MECWSNGVLGQQHSITPTLQHSNTPILQYSNTPILQYSNTPALQHSVLRSPFSRSASLRCWCYRAQLLETVRANAVREIRPRMRVNVGLDLAPVALVVADALAPGANGEEAVQRFDILQHLRQARRNAP